MWVWSVDEAGQSGEAPQVDDLGAGGNGRGAAADGADAIAVHRHDGVGDRRARRPRAGRSAPRAAARRPVRLRSGRWPGTASPSGGRESAGAARAGFYSEFAVTAASGWPWGRRPPASGGGRPRWLRRSAAHRLRCRRCRPPGRPLPRPPPQVVAPAGRAAVTRRWMGRRACHGWAPRRRKCNRRTALGQSHGWRRCASAPPRITR